MSKKKKKRKRTAGGKRRTATHTLPVADQTYDQAVHNFNRGNAKRAVDLCRETLANNPRHGPSHDLLAALVFRSGEYEAALNHANQAVLSDPTSVNFLSTLAQIQTKLRLLPQAIASLQTALQLQPQSVDLLNYLAAAQSASGQHGQALKTCVEALSLAPQNVDSLILFGDVLYEMGQPQDALKNYQAALNIEPDNPILHFACGKVQQGLRDYESARQSLQNATDLKPDFVLPLVLLARQDKGVPGDQRIARLENLQQQDNLALNDQIHVNFGLGKLYEDCGDYDRAFACYSTGNLLRGKIKPIGDALSSFEQELDVYHRVCDQNYFDERQSFGNPTELPIFVIGMPRSGTTLVERILDSHPAIHGAGELRHVAEMAAGLFSQTPTDQWSDIMTTLAATQVGSASATYCRHLQSLSPAAKRIVDKLPGNFRHLWLISLLFPQAKVIHCRRDPLDTCLSCFCTDFEMAHGYSCDLSALGRMYLLYEKLMAHWQSTVPVPILDLDYEDLVTNQETVSRSLVEFTGLPWDQACLEFHQHGSSQAIRTASNVQVGRKIYSSSVGRWRRFEKHLQPLQASLGLLSV